jgi:SLT domain-containing protein/phage-related protein
MPEGTKVGDVYVEGRLEYDARNTPAFSAALQRDLRRSMPAVAESVSSIFGDGISNGINTGFTRGMDRAQTQLDRRLRSLNMRTPDLDVSVDRALANIDSVQRELITLGQTDVTADVKIEIDRAMAELTALRAAVERPMTAHVDIETDPIRNKIKGVLADALTPDPAIAENLFETLRTGFSRSFVGLFTSPAGIGIGVAMVKMLVGAIGAGMSFLGAALTGAIIGGINLGAIAAGIALISDHPKIAEAGTKLKDKLFSGLKDAALPFVEPTLKAIDRLDAALDKVMPNIKRIMELVAPWVGEFADALGSVLERVMPALENVVVASKPIMEALADVMRDMGPAMAGFLNALVSDPRAVEGAAQALRDMGSIITAMLPALGHFLKELAITWPVIRPLVMEILDILKRMFFSSDANWETFRENVREGLEMLKAMLLVLEQLIVAMNTLSKIDPANNAPEIRARWDAMLNGMKETWNRIWGDIKADWIEFKEGFNTALGEIKNFWNTTWGDVKADWNSFKESINSGINEIKGWWNSLTEDIRNIGSSAFGAILGAWQAFRDSVNAIIEAIKGTWNSLPSSLDGLASRVEGVLGAVRGAWDAFRGFIQERVNAIRETVRTMFDQNIDLGFLDRVRQAWEAVRDAVQTAIEQIRENVRSGWDNIRTTVTQAIDQIRSAVEGGWNAVRSVVETVVGAIRGVVDTGFGSIRESVTSRMNEIRSAVQDVWNTIRGVFEQVISLIQGALTSAFNSLRDTVRTTWNDITTAIQNAWNTIRTAVFDQINQRTDDLKTRFNAMKDTINTAWQGVKDTAVRIWGEIRTQVFDPMGDMISNQIPQKYEEFKGKIIRIFSEVRDTIGRIWNEMLAGAKSAVGTIAGFINGVIKAINAIPFMKQKLDELPGFADGGAVIQGKARGGEINGGPRGTDTVPALSTWGQRYMLDNGEHILTKGDVRAMGGQEAVYQFRDALHKGLPGNYALGGRILKKATGGRVDAGNNGLLESHRDHVHVAMDGPPMSFPQIILKAAQSGIPHSVGSTFRPGSRGSGGGLDHHSEGRAVDFPGFNQDAFASFWEKTSGVIELIHRSATRDYAIFGGGGGGGGVSAVITWLMSAAGKAVKAAFDKAMSGLKGFIDGDELKGNTMAPGVLRNMFTDVAGQLSSYFDFNASAGGGGAPAAPEELKKWIAEAQKYVTIEDINRLLTLIMRESGGNPRAINLTDSNAQKGTPSKGLMQTIDPTFQAYRDKRLPNDPYDPVANIVAGMNYIHARYGSLMNVQQANANAAPRGYAEGGAIEPLRRVLVDNGGVLPPGSEGFFKNATSETEYALTATHMRDLFGDHGGTSQDNTINVYVDGVRRDARTEVERNAKKVAGALRAGGRS